MSRGKMKGMYPGNNTYQGFHSFFDQIVAPDANKVFILESGPGIGIPSFMRKIGYAMLDRGFDVEFHWCSSDPNTLDALYIPSIDVGLIDATAPHAIEPKNPGAVEEIIHLGDYWDEEKVRSIRKPVIELTREIKHCFDRAHGYLKAAKICLDQWESFYAATGVLDVGGLNELANEIIDGMFRGRKGSHQPPRHRHLFATAITPEGPRNHLSTIVGPLRRRILISGEPGTGKSTLLNKATEYAFNHGFDAEVYHCALIPERVDHLVIPELSAAVVTSAPPHVVEPLPGDLVYSTNRYVNGARVERYLGQVADAKSLYNVTFRAAVWYVAQSKKVRDELRDHYLPHIDFNAMDKKCQETLERILNIAKKLGVAAG